MAAWWPGDYDQQELSDHSHCQTCYNWKNCDRLEKQLYSCAIVDCPNECPFRFHSCKLEEHLSLCPSTICRCLNVEYGCPQSLPRWKLADHLRICPASVVVCPLVWNRQKGPMEGDLKFLRTAGTGTLVKACGQGELDVAFARKDQLAIQSGFSYPRAIRRRIKGGADYILPSLPFVTNWQKVGSQWASGLMGEEVAAEDNYSSEEEDKPVEPPVSRDCIICRTDPSSQHLHVLGSLFVSGMLSPIFEGLNPSENSVSKTASKGKVGPDFSQFYCKRELKVDITTEFLSLGSSGMSERKKKFFTFCCNQLLRRDQFSDHCRDVHTMIISGLNGSLIERCPMHLYGCDELQCRFTPDGNRLIYNEYLESFAVVSTSEELMVKNDLSLIEVLPYELLHKVVEFLDTGSLYCLSATSKHLRTLCSTFLPSHGVTDITWVKTKSSEGLVRWLPGKQRWLFPKMFHPVRNWQFQLSSLGSHVTKCQYYDPVVHSENRVRVIFTTS